MTSTQAIHFESSALPEDARVIAFRGREALGAPYEYEVWLSTAAGEEVDLEDALFAPAALSIDAGDASAARGPFHVRGILAGIDHVHEHAGRAIFSALIVPRLWLLGQSEHSRVFSDKRFDEILRLVVDTVGISGADLDIQAPGLPVEEHVCQYRESDLAFLHRWLEREGLTYYFDHSGDAEKLIVTDAQPSEVLEGGPIRYHPTLGAKASDFTAQGHFQRIQTKRVAMPRTVTLRDHDYGKPKLDVSGQGEVLRRAQVEVVRFGERFFDPDRGASLAKLRSQALRSKQEIQIAEGTVLGVRPGRVVEIEEHPRAALNQRYLVLSTEHTGVSPSQNREVLEELVGFDQEDLLRVRAELLASTVEYKPPSTSRWPTIHSHELAVVDGPADSEYAQLDEQGRYKVRFLFDEGDTEAGKASTWVRMMQPHGGNPEGIHFPLRKGTEVAVSFLGGDPDRPIIAGAVPNAETPSPVTSSNNTKNVLVTGGRNKLEIEDLDGQQWINWYTPSENTEIHMGYPKPFGKAQANLGEHTDGTASFTFGGDWYVDVGGLHDEHVTGSVMQKYDATRDETVAGNVTETYAANHDVTISGSRTHTVSGSMTETISGALTQTFSGGWAQTVAGGWTQGVSGGWTQVADTVDQTISGVHTQTVGGAQSLTVGGAQTLAVGGSQTMSIGGAATWDIGGGVTLTAPSLKTIGASWEQVDASIVEQSNFKAETCYVALAMTGVKAEQTSLNLAYTVLSIEAKSAHLEDDGVNLSNKGPHISNAGLHVLS